MHSIIFLSLHPTLINPSCKPQLAQSILAEEGIKDALDGKLLISILAGVTISQMKAWVHDSTKVIRAMPNTPCKVSKVYRILYLLLLSRFWT